MHEAATTDIWLKEPLFPPSVSDTPPGVAESQRRALISDFREFLSSCQFVDIKSVEIGGKGWKSTKTTTGYVLRRQQESYKRLCARRELSAN